jgi:replicative DNA helicase
MFTDALTPAGYALPTVELAFIATAVQDAKSIPYLLDLGVTGDHFATRQTRLAWQLANDLPLEGDRPLEFGKKIVLDETLRHEVGAPFVTSLLQTPTILGRESLEWHWKRLEGARIHRALVAERDRLTRQLEGLRLQEVGDSAIIASDTAANLQAIAEHVKPAALMHISRAAIMAMEECEKSITDEEDGDPDGKPGRIIRWQNEELGRLGNAPRGLVVIGGQTSAGKSVLALQMADEFMEGGRHGIIFSLEMGPGEVIRRLATVRAQTQIHNILNPYGMTEHGMSMTTTALAQIGQDDCWVSTEEGITIEKARSIARHHARTKPLDFIVFDYIQIASTDRNVGDSREGQISYIAMQLKQMARELDCMVITASQLNDDGKLRESRAIGQHADIVLRIDESGVFVDKNRNGERHLTLSLWLDGARQRFLKNPPNQPTQNNGPRTKR